MKKGVIVFSLVLSVLSFAQNESINSGKYYPAKEIFKQKYKPQNYTKFPFSQIKIFPEKVILEDLKSIEYPISTERKYKLIFENGLLDPYEICRVYQLKICCIEELNLLNPNYQTKRFKFWIFPSQNIKSNASDFEKTIGNTINPNEYYFELQNKNADESTNFENFVKGSELTFLIFGTIVI